MAKTPFTKLAVFSSGLLVLVPLGVVAAVRLQADDAAPAPQDTASAPRSRGENASSFLGVVIPEEALELTPPIAGRLRSVHVKVGDSVSEDSVLAELDTRALQQDLATAQAAFQSARADQQAAELSLAQAKERLARREDPKQLLLGALSEEELATARHEHRLAGARLEVLRAKAEEQGTRVARLQQDIAETQLRAPFSGVVSGRFMDPGARAEPGKVILQLLRRGKTQVRFAIPEHEVQHVSQGQFVQVKVPEQGQSFTGRVVSLAPEVDTASRMVFALAELDAPAPHSPLLSGAVVRVLVLPAVAQRPQEKHRPGLPP